MCFSILQFFSLGLWPSPRVALSQPDVEAGHGLLHQVGFVGVHAKR